MSASAPYDARAVANLFLDLADARHLRLTQVSLLKLLYFAHGWYLASHSNPLIVQEFEALQYGPIVKVVWDEFKSFGAQPITSRASKLDIYSGRRTLVPPDLSPHDGRFVQSIFEAYHVYDAWQLSDMTHEPGSRKSPAITDLSSFPGQDSRKRFERPSKYALISTFLRRSASRPSGSVNVQDVARALGTEPTYATPEQVAAWVLSEYVGKPGGRFNYNTAIAAAYDLFRGAISEQGAILYCSTTGNPNGRAQNADAIKHVAPYALENISTCYQIGFTAVAAGRVAGKTLYIGIKTPMVRVLHNEAFVVMPGFRMAHRPVEAEIDVACSIALATFARDDFANADFEYLYAGPGASAQREFHAIRGKDRKVYDRDAVDAFLEIYVKGVALAVEAGATVREPSLKGYRIIDPREPRFF